MTDRNPKGDIICDFCASTAPVTVYECDDFKLDSAAPVTRSVRACVDCAALVDGGQWPELVDRALAVFEQYNKSVPYTNTTDEIRQDITKLFGITTVRLNVEENQLVNVFSEFSVCVGSLKSA